MAKILQKSIIKEIFSHFSSSFLLLSSVFISVKFVKIFEILLGKGVPLEQLFKMILYTMPEILLYLFPICTYFSVFVTFARLSDDNEIVALKSSGISLFKIATPVLLFASLVCLLSLYISFQLAPVAATKFKIRLFELARANLEKGIESRTFNNRFPNMVLYVNKKCERGKLCGIFISFRKDGKENIISAKTGQIKVSMKSPVVLFSLKDGSIHRETKSGYQKIDFSTYVTYMNIRTFLPYPKHKLSDYPFFELLKIEREKRKKGKKAKKEIFEIHKRITIPFSSILFSIFGMVFGIMVKKGGRFWSILFGLSLILVYYLLLSISRNITETLNNPVLFHLAYWTPMIFLLPTSILLLTLCDREKI